MNFNLPQTNQWLLLMTRRSGATRATFYTEVVARHSKCARKANACKDPFINVWQMRVQKVNTFLHSPLAPARSRWRHKSLSARTSGGGGTSAPHLLNRVNSPRMAFVFLSRVQSQMTDSVKLLMICQMII